jgi:hypothetical protein
MPSMAVANHKFRQFTHKKLKYPTTETSQNPFLPTKITKTLQNLGKDCKSAFQKETNGATKWTSR